MCKKDKWEQQLKNNITYPQSQNNICNCNTQVQSTIATRGCKTTIEKQRMLKQLFDNTPRNPSWGAKKKHSEINKKMQFV